jgi:hypothetical protein
MPPNRSRLSCLWCVMFALTVVICLAPVCASNFDLFRLPIVSPVAFFLTAYPRSWQSIDTGTGSREEQSP